jgi:hypothetical protein
MEVTTVVSILGVFIAVFTVTMTLANMEPEKREWLRQLWTRWLNRAFYVVLFVNSPLGILTFWLGSGPVTRGAVLLLLLHFFNLCAGFVFLFLEQTEKALVARNAKREELEEKVKALEERRVGAHALSPLDLPH